MEVLIWKIGNFSFCLRKAKEYLESPMFTGETGEDDGWVLKLYPNYLNDDIYVSLSGGPNVGISSYSIAIVAVDGTMQYTVQVMDGYFTKTNSGVSPKRLVNRDEIFWDKAYFLPRDTLNIRCEIKRFTESTLVTRCTIRTQMKVERISVPWNITNFSSFTLGQESSQPVTVKFRKAPLFAILLELEGDALDSSCLNVSVKKISQHDYHYKPEKQNCYEQNCYEQNRYVKSSPKERISYEQSNIAISSNVRDEVQEMKHVCGVTSDTAEDKSCYLTIKPNSNVPETQDWLDSDVLLRCNFFTLDAKGGHQHNSEGDCYFKRSRNINIWSLAKIDRSDLLSEDNSHEDTLFMRFEFIVSNCEHITVPSEVETFYPESRSDVSTDPRMDHFEQLFRDQDFCDVRLRTTDKEVMAHKVVLCARSPVFKAMFKSDMAEKNTGIVNVADVDGGTLDLMLSFFYTGVLRDVKDYKRGIKLYMAADKYQVSSMKEQCARFLMSAVSPENVFEILCLASKYHDKTLKNNAKGYICKHPIEALDSKACGRLTADGFDRFPTETELMVNEAHVGGTSAFCTASTPAFSKKRKL